MRFNQQPLVWEMLMSSLGCAFPVLFSILLLGVLVLRQKQFWCITPVKQSPSILTPSFSPPGFSLPQAPGWRVHAL